MDGINIAAALLIGIMIAASLPVNAKADESKTVTQPSDTAVTKDSPVTSKREIDQLVDFLLKKGEEEPIGGHIAPVMGLPGPVPSKVASIDSEDHPSKHGFDHSARVCSLIYEQSPGAGDKRPVCVYLKKHMISGYDDETRYFRIGLDGRLEKAVFTRGKIDADGKTVRGSGKAFDQDIESSATKKAFAAEMTAMRKWLKAQRKLLAKADTMPAATSPSAATPSTP